MIDGPAPAGPFEMHAFHPEKLLLDPYARCIEFGKAPLGMIVACERSFEWGDDRRTHHEADAVIYELHVRGFTQNPNSGVSAAARGTFAVVVEKIPYLRELGVTIVELMPVFQFDPHGRDTWGYMPFWRDDVHWFGANGPVDFSGHALAWCLRASQGDRDLYVMVNNSHQPTTFVMQETGRAWHRVVDAARQSPEDIELDHPPLLTQPTYMLGGDSLVVLASE